MKQLLKWGLAPCLAISLALSGVSAKAGSYEAFFAALTFDRVAEVQSLLARGFDPNTPNEKGLPALLVALQSDAMKSALVLAQHPQTKVEVTNAVNETPLMLAAIRNQLALAKTLIARGAEVNRPGWTPLHYAATRGHREMMRLLLEHNAYIDSEAPNGSTPLMLAAYAGTPLAVKLLLEEGADPTLVNQNQASALDLALSADQRQSAFYIRAFTVAWFVQNPIKEAPVAK